MHAAAALIAAALRGLFKNVGRTLRAARERREQQ